MISFDISKTLFFNVGIEIFSVCIVLILLVISKRDVSESQDKLLFYKMQLLLLIVLISDIIMWLINGIPGSLSRIAGYVDNIIYFLAQLWILAAWLYYSCCRIYGKRLGRKTELIILSPLFIMSLCVITTPWTRWCFYLDDLNYYHRGVLCSIFAIIVLGYLVCSSLAALYQKKKEVLLDRKRECSSLSFFAILPLIGGSIQAYAYGCSLIWPSVTLAALFIFVNSENQAISQDALTGLNNRGNLERHLNCGLDSGRGKQIALLMLDINEFKQVNDKYGHEAGDKALAYTAELLKTSLCEPKAFLSRYGGDEFVVVLNGKGEREAEAASEKMRRSIASFNDTKCFPCRLTVSIGYAAGVIASSDDIKRILKEADEKMYIEKQKFYSLENKQKKDTALES